MNFLAHIAIGLSANAILLWFLEKNNLFHFSTLYNPFFAIPLVLAIILFSILPDIDSINSLASKIFRLILFILAIAVLIEFINTKDPFALGKAVLALLIFAGHFLYAKSSNMHRQFPHTLLFGVIACLIAFLITGSKTTALVSASSFALHLIADNCFFSALKHDLSYFKR